MVSFVQPFHNHQNYLKYSYKEQETTWSNLKQPRMSKNYRAFHLFFKLISNIFSIWYILWVLPLTAHLRVGGAVPQWEHVETWWKLVSTLSRTSCNLANLFPICDFFYFYWSLRATIRQITLDSLAKWLSVRLRPKWVWVGIPLLSLKL